MYREHFQLTSQPFSLVPRSGGSIMVPGFKRELDRCQAAIDESRTPLLLTGPAGSGKTTLLSLLETRFAPSLRTVRLGCASITSRTELFQVLLYENGLPFETGIVGELRLNLIEFLKSGQHCPDGMLLLVDEAHLLTDDVLEEVRMLSNLVCNGRCQLRFVLAGNLELEEIVAHNVSLNQRISLRSCLAPYSYNETMLFIMAQIQMAGSDGRRIFLPSSIEKIHSKSGGIARVICQLADASLRLAAQRKARSVDAQTVDDAWQDLQHLPVAVADARPAELSADPRGPSVVEFGELSDERKRSTPDHPTSLPAQVARETVVSVEAREAIPEKTEIPTPEQITSQLKGECENKSIQEIDAALRELRRQLIEMNQYSRVNSEMPEWRSPGGTEFTGFDIPYRPLADMADEGAGTKKPSGVDPAELFGSGFEQEEDVGTLHIRQVIEQNRSSSAIATSEIPGLVESDTEPGWVPQGPEVLVAVPEKPEKAAAPGSSDTERHLPIVSAPPDPEHQRFASDRADDEEIVLVSKSPAVPPSQPVTKSAPPDPPDSSLAIRPGQAIRMDYTELFRQLRNAPQSDLDIR